MPVFLLAHVLIGSSMNRLLGLFSFTLLIACSSNEESSHRFQVYEEDGITVAETTGGPLYKQPFFKYEHILELQQDTDDEDAMLWDAHDFVLGSDGCFYVLDKGNRRIAVFDDEGRYVRSFGRSGGGPGEFSRGVMLQDFDGSILSIFDVELQRTTRYHTNGNLIEVLSYSAGERRVGAQRIGDDHLLLLVGTHETRGEWQYYTSKVLITKASTKDTLGIITLKPLRTAKVIHVTTSDGLEGTGYGMIQFNPRTVIDFAFGTGIMVSNGADPEIRIYNNEAKLTRIIRVDLQARKVTDTLKERKEAFSDSIQSVLNIKRSSPIPDLSEPPYADKVGFWDDGFIDDVGFIWLEDVYANKFRGLKSTTVFHVFSPEGQYFGLTTIPCRNVNINGGVVCGNLYDRFTGENTHVVYRILPIVKGLEYP